MEYTNVNPINLNSKLYKNVQPNLKNLSPPTVTGRVWSYSWSLRNSPHPELGGYLDWSEQPTSWPLARRQSSRPKNNNQQLLFPVFLPHSFPSNPRKCQICTFHRLFCSLLGTSRMKHLWRWNPKRVNFSLASRFLEKFFDCWIITPHRLQYEWSYRPYRSGPSTAIPSFKGWPSRQVGTSCKRNSQWQRVFRKELPGS